MADSPMPIAATVREAIKQTAHIERLAGQIDGESAQRQRWYLDPKLWTILLPIIGLMGGADYWAISTYQAAQDRSVVVAQRIGEIEVKLSTAINMKSPLDQVILDVHRLDEQVDAIQRDRSAKSEQMFQRLAVTETKIDAQSVAIRDLTTELHRLNERLSDRRTQIFVPPTAEAATVSLPPGR